MDYTETSMTTRLSCLVALSRSIESRFEPSSQRFVPQSLALQCELWNRVGDESPASAHAIVFICFGGIFRSTLMAKT